MKSETSRLNRSRPADAAWSGEAHGSSPRSWLRQVFLDRQKKNASYSLRAFARDIGMSQPLLSLVLNGQRPLTLKQAYKIAALLKLTHQNEKELIERTLQFLPENSKISKQLKRAQELRETVVAVRDLDIERYRTIASGLHFAILDLTTTHDFKADASWIARRLGASKVEVEAAIERLLLLGLLVRDQRGLKKNALHIQFPTRESKSAVRAFHSEMISKAQEQLKDPSAEAFARRSITGHTVAIDTKLLPEAVQFIEQMQAEFIRRFTTGRPDEVYQLNVQFFPLTQPLMQSLKKNFNQEES